MNLVDRYLAAIGALLPRFQRDDVIAELRDGLETEIEARRADLGRALTVAEESDLLRAFGHPIAVAGRYGRQQYLVGPELFPLYLFALKVVLLIALAAALLAGAVAAALHPGDWALGFRAVSSAIWHGAIGAAVALTVTAALLERYDIRLGFLTQWSPEDLPAPTQSVWSRPRTVFDHIAGALAQTLFIAWWVHIFRSDAPDPTLVAAGSSAGHAVSLIPALVWRPLYWPVLGLALAAVACHVLALLGQAWRLSVRALEVAANLGLLCVALDALSAGHWVDVVGSGFPAAAVARIDGGVNIGVEVALIVIALVGAGLAFRNGWRLVWRRPVGSSSGRLEA